MPARMVRVLAVLVLFAAFASAPARADTAAQASLRWTTGDGVSLQVVNSGTSAIRTLSVALARTGFDLGGPFSNPGCARSGVGELACSGLNLAPGAALTFTFLVTPRYPHNAGAELLVSADGVTSAGPFPVTGPTATPVPQPVAGRSELVTPLVGSTFVRLRGTTRFKRLTGALLIADGSEIDTTHGTLRLTVAHARSGASTDSATVSQGRAIVHQDRSAHPVTTLSLSLHIGCAHRRQLLVRETAGQFQSRGVYGAATGAGGAWQTVDTCKSTTITVLLGQARVTSVPPFGPGTAVPAGNRVVITPN